MSEQKPGGVDFALNAGLGALDARLLASYMLDQPWHKHCELIPAYMPPYPREDTRPKFCVRFNDGTEHPPFLRYSRGPKQGFFWDIYGDDMQSAELAVLALSKAPAPVPVGPMVFRIPLAPNARIQAPAERSEDGRVESVVGPEETK